MSSAEEISKIFPKYGEFKIIREGEKNIMCKIFGHKKRFIHHRFFTEKTKRGKEWYECWVCPRCLDIEGKLVNISGL